MDKELKRDIGSSAKAGINNFLIPAIDALIAQQPEFIPPWILAKGFFGALFDIHQDRINEFVEFIKDNPETFTKELVDTKEFREGFLITFEAYLKQRNEEKRKIIQGIFLGFSQGKRRIDFENFEMEKMYDFLTKLSLFDLHILKEIERKSIKIRDDQQNIVEKDYDIIKHLEYIGLVNSRRKSDIDVESNYDDSEATYSEEETFYLSVLGEDFIKFVQE